MSTFPTKMVMEEGVIGDEIPIEELRPKPLKHVFLIVGDSSGVWNDLVEFFSLGIEHDTMLLNNMPLAYPYPYQHFGAGDAHNQDMQDVAKSINGTILKHSWNPRCEGFNVRWIKDDHQRGRRTWEGTTASLAITVGLKLGYLKMVLAGVPMDNSGHWYDQFLKPEDVKRLSDHRDHMWKWREISVRPVGRLVRSMSGQTAEILGKPTRQWLLDIPKRLSNGA